MNDRDRYALVALLRKHSHPDLSWSMDTLADAILADGWRPVPTFNTEADDAASNQR